jgi:hypothetical protein
MAIKNACLSRNSVFFGFHRPKRLLSSSGDGTVQRNNSMQQAGD